MLGGILRCVLFFVVIALWTFLFCFPALLPAALIPASSRKRWIYRPYCWVCCTLARLIWGIKWRIKGLVSLPAEPCVIMCNHQSSWESIFLPVILPSHVSVVKRELLLIPFFGWTFRQLKPIAIDRRQRLSAMRQIEEQGKKALEQGFSVLIFPEGTRCAAGTLGRFSKSAAILAIKNNKAVLPIVHNAGYFWRNDSLIKRQGTIDLVVGAPIPTAGKTAACINAEVKSWMREHLAKPSATPYPKTPHAPSE